MSSSPSPQRRHVFVVGMHRSGTSILAELLKAHPLISGHAIQEMPEELENEGQHIQVRIATCSAPLRAPRGRRPTPSTRPATSDLTHHVPPTLVVPIARSVSSRLMTPLAALASLPSTPSPT